MPDKRQTSKQRRAARNRASREALIARRENAQAEREQARQAAPSRAATSASAGRGGGGASDGRPAPGIAGALYRRAPAVGDTAVLMALFFGVLAAGLSLYVAFTSSVVPVDHAGEPLGRFPAVSRQAYAIAHDTEPVTEKVSLVDAFGPVIAIFAFLPALVLVAVFISHRREVRSRPLTFGLVALALLSVFNTWFSVYFLPSLIALAVAGFQVRKTEMPARAGGAGARGRPARRGTDEDDDVIDVDEVEPGDRDADDVADERADAEVRDTDADTADADTGEVRDAADDVIDVDEARPEDRDADDAGDGDAGDRSDDVLAELEAEIEDESAGEPEAGRRGRRPGAGGRSSRR